MKKITIIITYLTLSFPIAPALIAMNQDDEEVPILFYADSQTYDRDLGILILKGNVEFQHDGDVLEADYVTYNENTEIVTASGNVRMRQENGDVEFAEYVELTGDLKQGIVLELRTLLEDDSKIAALEGRKCDQKQELDQAVYTPCLLCGDKPPTWQINARRAVKDDETKNIHFTDAEMRILDVPVMYFPYATQPLERRSGFLIPRPKVNSHFGASTDIPVYWAPAEDIDMTFRPVIYSKQHPLYQAEYRQAFGNGVWSTNGAVLNYLRDQKEKKQIEAGEYSLPRTRGYVVSSGEFNFNDIWRGRFNGGYVSDKTFFRKFDYPGAKHESYLLSEGILEGFLNQRDYAAAKVYHFQGLKDADRQSHLSNVLPVLEYSAYSCVDPLGGRFKFDGNFLNIYRTQGINMQRGVGEVSWQRPMVINHGQVLTLHGALRGDLYDVQGDNYVVFRGNKISLDKKGGARFFPQAGLNWRWPFIASFQGQSLVIQPVAQLIVAPDKPYGLKSRRVPNEDSTDFEFNDANLFSYDRISGYDLIDSGSRFVYGGEILTTGSCIGDFDIFLGQSYSLSDSNDFAGDLTEINRLIGKKPNVEDEAGFGRRASDIVGRIEARPTAWLNLNYRFRLDQKTLSHRIAEVGGSIGPSIARISGDYVFISKRAGTSNGQNFNQTTFTISSAFTRHWAASFKNRQNLQSKNSNGGPLERAFTLDYRDDCFGLDFTVKREFYKDRDVRNGTTFLLTLWFKNIGSFNAPFNLQNGLFGENAFQVN